ncbi:MAG: ABC transporter permease [Candidatus Eisenbacteria bacterium]|uniref:Cell division protein FtsX n=1 Tax=Eiseniibacteriota bacterium TaxID=2212470 RepID=A0A9D6QI92_UNCEI|nr:ABC transporter permease [Candidatus Eisenbacteria bacterium]MBI3539047.1 ABC transporter permease [Candidatus Eisenbacteria bacterium]
MHAFYFREASRSFRQHRGLGTTAIFVLTAALALIGGFMMLSYNAQIAVTNLGDRREMIVYLRDEVTPAERQALITRLSELYGAVTYVSKEEAWEALRRQVGDPSLLDGVDENPLPASLRIRLKPALLTPEAMDAASRQVSGFPEVEDVRYGAEWVRRLHHFGNGLRLGTIAVGLIVAIAVGFVVYNTIHLTVLARRHQVEIMSRLGATDGFIAWPFVIEAVFEVGLAALLALAAVFGLQRLLDAQLIRMVFLPPVWALGFFVVAIALAWFAAWLALSRVLRSVGP